MRGVEDIEKGISGFVKYWEDLCNVDVTGEYQIIKYEHLVQYWHDVKEALYETNHSMQCFEGRILANNMCGSKC